MAKLETLTDNFTTASSANWWGYGEYGSDSPVVTSGRLVLTPTSGYPTLSSQSTYDLTASFAMVQFVQNANVGLGSITVEFGVKVDSDNALRFVVAGNTLIFREAIGGANSDTSVTYSSATHKFFRIRESGGTVYWETSADSLAWTTQRSKTTTLTLTALTAYFMAGFWDAETSAGTALFDNFNLQSPPASYTGWTVGGLAMGGAVDGGTIEARNYFDTASWLWDPIPNNPVLDPNSAAIVTSLASTDDGALRVAGMHDYGVTLVGPTGIDTNTPRYDITFTNDPAWGSDPFGSDTMPIPNGTPIPPGTDGQIAVADPTTNKVFSIWQATDSGSWGASWGGEVDLHGDGLEQAPASSTASQISRYAAVIRASEIAAGQIPHALFFATDMADPSAYRYPAGKTDGDNSAGVSIPILEGARVQLDPSIDVESIPGITAGEIAVAKALQTYGAYCGDKGGSRMAFSFEYQNDGNPGQIYVDAGLQWDYFDMNHIPWSSLRVLNSWDGS